ncbi:hypothetical protein [Halorubrum persicum]|uniref:hypothetical protein n=1 Tax=Halorubrum persicum TaxID=1383844 RepID=UPI0011819BF6|nr:hypothetical protein [Halorubrum persicum]
MEKEKYDKHLWILNAIHNNNTNIEDIKDFIERRDTNIDEIKSDTIKDTLIYFKKHGIVKYTVDDDDSKWKITNPDQIKTRNPFKD